nr:hypothetical protein [Flavihumibacter fluvii]
MQLVQEKKFNWEFTPDQYNQIFNYADSQGTITAEIADGLRPRPTAYRNEKPIGANATAAGPVITGTKSPASAPTPTVDAGTQPGVSGGGGLSEFEIKAAALKAQKKGLRIPCVNTVVAWGKQVAGI